MEQPGIPFVFKPKSPRKLSELAWIRLLVSKFRDKNAIHAQSSTFQSNFLTRDWCC